MIDSDMIQFIKEVIRLNVLEHDEKFRYQLLDRMRQDVQYVLRQAETSKENSEVPNWKTIVNNVFWGGTENHFSTMKELFNSFGEQGQPEWYSLSQMNSEKRRLEELIGFELG